MIKNSENLHSHTTLSDGKLTHRETLDIARDNGCAIVAFTDHDILPPDHVIEELDRMRDHETKWVIGIELSTAMGHVVGLFIDPHNEALRAHTVNMREERQKKATAMASGLANLGFTITAEEVLARAGEGNVTKPHVVDSLLSHPENIPLIETYVKKLEEAAKTDEETRLAYEDAKQLSYKWGIGMFVYPLFLRTRALVEGVHQDLSVEPKIEDGTKLIRDAGGLAFFAHWNTSKKNLPIEHLEKLLSENVLDGVESVWGLNYYGTDLEQSMLDDNRLVNETLKRTGKIGIPSLDAHYKEQYELLGKTDRFASLTVGLTAELLDKSKVNTKFSSL